MWQKIYSYLLNNANYFVASFPKTDWFSNNTLIKDKLLALNSSISFQEIGNEVSIAKGDLKEICDILECIEKNECNYNLLDYQLFNKNQEVL